MSKKQQTEPIFATAEETAEALMLNLRKVQLLCKAGEIPARRYGVAWRIPWAWIRQQAEIAPKEEVA